MRKLSFILPAFLALAQLAFAAAPAIPPGPPAPSLRGVSGLVITFLGDSEAQLGTANSPPGTQYISSSYSVGTAANSYVGWLISMANGGLVYDPATFGIAGNVQGLAYVIPISNGNCTPSATLTFQAGAATAGGLPHNTAGPFTVSFDAAGRAFGQGTPIYLASPGSGYAAQPAYTVTGGTCTTQPSFAYALTGTGTFGVPGDMTAGALARVPLLCALKPDIVVVEIGTNNLGNGVGTVASINADTDAIVAALQACNARVVLMGISSRNIGVSGWTATLDLQRQAINAHRWSLARQNALQANKPPVVYVDTDRIMTDVTQSGATIGNPVAACTIDGLHNSPYCAFAKALMVFDAIHDWLTPMRPRGHSQSDAYDAANNPTGNLLGANGNLLSSTGTVNAPCTGQAPASWTVNVSGQSVGMTCTVAVQARTDGYTGQEVLITVSNATGNASEKLSFTSSVSTANINRGVDKLKMYVESIDLSNAVGVQYLGCRLLETATINQAAEWLNSGNVGSSYPLPSSAQLHQWPEARWLREYEKTASGSFSWPCFNPPMQTQVTATAYSANIYVQAGGNYSYTVKIRGSIRVDTDAAP